MKSIPRIFLTGKKVFGSKFLIGHILVTLIIIITNKYRYSYLQFSLKTYVLFLLL